MAVINLKAIFEDMNKCFECAVCMDKFKDPRSLSCQHQFCSGCLQSLINIAQGENATLDRIKCPTCREVTHLKTRRGLKDLPRPTLLNTLQDLVDKVVGSDHENLDISLCDICREFEHRASSYCLQCNKHLCEPCLRKHEGFEPLKCHVTVPLLKELLCEAHGEVYMVYCETCKHNLCSVCTLKDHPVAHHTVDYHSELMYKIDNRLNRHKLNYQKLTKTLKNKVKEVEASFEKTESEICKWYTKSKALLREWADHLLKELLKTKIKQNEKFLKEAHNKETEVLILKFPVGSDVLEKNTTQMKAILADIKLQYQTDKLCKYGDEAFYPLDWADDIRLAEDRNCENLTKVVSLKLNKSVTDIQFDDEIQRILVKTKSMDTPVKVFNYQGEQTGQWGQSIKGINGEGAICLDTKRNLYLMTCTDSIAIVNKLGYVQDKIRIPIMNKKHCGIAYSSRDDLYAVTDIGNHCLQVVDPRTKGVVRRCGTKGEGNFRFDGPYYVQFNERSPQTSIAVSDVNNHCVKVFDINCTPVHTFGSFGYGEDMLDHPRGLLTDKKGRTVICDQFNHRVVRHWVAGDKTLSECVINSQQLDNECPWAIGYSERDNLLAISYGTGELSIYSGYGNTS